MRESPPAGVPCLVGVIACWPSATDGLYGIECDKPLLQKLSVNATPFTKRTRGGTRAVDLELTVLSNALSLAVRRGRLKTNPLRIGEGLGGRWRAVNWAEELIHVKRSQRGLIPGCRFCRR